MIPTCPTARPLATKKSGNKPHTMPSLRLFTIPAWLAANSARTFLLVSRKI
jgi:hypothetical protein